MNEYPKVVDNLIWIDKHTAVQLGAVPVSISIDDWTWMSEHRDCGWRLSISLTLTDNLYIKYYEEESMALNAGLAINNFMQDVASLKEAGIS